jgi:hypothetical protein
MDAPQRGLIYSVTIRKPSRAPGQSLICRAGLCEESKHSAGGYERQDKPLPTDHVLIAQQKCSDADI